MYDSSIGLCDFPIDLTLTLSLVKQNSLLDLFCTAKLNTLKVEKMT